MGVKVFCIRENDIPKVAKSLRISTIRITDTFIQLCTETFQEKKGTLFQFSPLSHDFAHVLKYMSKTCQESTEETVGPEQTQGKISSDPLKRIYSTTIDKWCNFWYSQGLRKHKNKTSKTYKEDANSLRSLMRGTFFKDIYEYKEYADVEFTFDDWEKSVTNFAVAVKDPGVKPFNKNFIKYLSISEFLYNSYSKVGPDSFHSQFIYRLNNDSITILPDNPHHKITDSLVELYKQHLGGGYKPTMGHIGLFIKVSQRIANFFKVNAKHIAYCDTDFRSDWKKAEIVMKCLTDDNEQILPHYFLADKLYEDKLPEYLRKIGIWLN